MLNTVFPLLCIMLTNPLMGEFVVAFYVNLWLWFHSILGY